jgi:hypothetical protein
VSTKRITEPIFFYGTVNSEWGVNNILEPSFEELTKNKRNAHIFGRTLNQYTPQKIQCGHYAIFSMTISEENYGSHIYQI